MKPFVPAVVLVTVLAMPVFAEPGRSDAMGRAELVHRMGQSAHRLDQQDTGEGTQEMQRQIALDLDRVIESLKQHDTGSPPPPAGDSRETGALKPPASSGEAAAGSAGNTGAGTASGAGSAAAVDPVNTRAFRELRAEQINLPPGDRAAILNGITHGFLPEYQVQIRKYYEALAELHKK